MTAIARAAGGLLALLLVVSRPHAGELRLPAVDRHQLDNGAVLLIAEQRDVPMVALEIHLRGGSLADPPGRDGTAALLAALMMKGAGARDGAAFADAVDAVGGALDIGSGRTALTLSAEFLAEDAPLMIELAADALRRPLLAAAEFARVRERAVQSLVAARDSAPDRLLGLYGAAWLFGDHPYGRPSGGSERTLAAIDHRDVVGFHRQHTGGDRLIVSVVGDIDREAVSGLLHAAFGDWPAARSALPEIAAPVPQRGRRVLLVDKPGAHQTYFWLGNVGAARTDPQRVAQDLVNTLFGGRFTSLLNTELRARSGLAYGAGSSIVRLPQPGPVSISSDTPTATTVEALDLALATLDRLHAAGFDAEQLESARRYLLGQFPPTLETAPQLASRLAALELFGLGREEIDGYAAALRAVDVAAAQAARAVFPSSHDLAIVLIGDAAAIHDRIGKYGPVTRMPITAPQFRPPP